MPLPPNHAPLVVGSTVSATSKVSALPAVTGPRFSTLSVNQAEALLKLEKLSLMALLPLSVTENVTLPDPVEEGPKKPKSRSSLLPTADPLMVHSNVVLGEEPSVPRLGAPAPTVNIPSTLVGEANADCTLVAPDVAEETTLALGEVVA